MYRVGNAELGKHIYLTICIRDKRSTANCTQTERTAAKTERRDTGRHRTEGGATKIAKERLLKSLRAGGPTAINKLEPGWVGGRYTPIVIS